MDREFQTYRKEHLDESEKIIGLCHECHLKHERYRNYLKDECGINIDRTSLAQE
jgi:hypothetical protein